VTGAVSLGRVAALFDTKPAVTDGSRPLEACHGAFELRNVTFAYGDQQVLHHLNLQVPAGKVTVLLGPSGSGKTTIADLMIRLYDPASGAVMLDGVDLREYRLADVRKHVAMVEQVPFLTHASIADNLRFAAPGASDAELQQAAADAQIDRFIERLPEGYATVAGERGLAVSAGERQRLALARTLLRNPSVLILDEPTSALDADTEAALVQSVRRRLPDATILIITHRRELAAIADHVATPF
jgi:ATP-binding cassette subfamily B protein